MYVHILKQEKQKKGLKQLHVRVVGEYGHESPLHELPALLEILFQKGLKSHATHFMMNPYGRFDCEVHARVAEIEDDHAFMDLERKVARLHHFFYEDLMLAEETMDFENFYEFIIRLEDNKYCTHTDEALFEYPVKWHGLLSTYQNVHETPISEDDAYHHILNHTDHHWIAPALNHKACPFDSKVFKEGQVVYGFQHFLVALNYRPIGDSRFHMMLIPYEHDLDLSKLSDDMLFELEALLRATLKICPRPAHEMGVYVQKHAQSGMTVPHLHLHVLSPSTRLAFLDDVKRQLRYFAATLDGRDEEARELSRDVLTEDEMAKLIWRFKSPLKRQMETEFKIQKLLPFGEKIRLKCMKFKK